MNTQRYVKDKKGINTILASLLMVVIVVVAAVMVYAWSTGLLGTLLVKPNTGEGPLSPDSFVFSNSTSVTIYVRNSGTSNVTLAAYYVTDSSSNTWQLLNWAGPTIAPNKAAATNIPISTSCGLCQYTGTANAFNGFTSGYSYTVKVVTVQYHTFTFTATKD